MRTVSSGDQAAYAETLCIIQVTSDRFSRFPFYRNRKLTL